MRLTVNEKDCLRFAYRHRTLNGWHSFSKRLKKTVQSLNRKGLVYMNYFSQFQISDEGEVFAYRNL